MKRISLLSKGVISTLRKSAPLAGAALVMLLLPTVARANSACSLNLGYNPGDAGSFGVFDLGNGGKIDFTNPQSEIEGSLGLGPNGIQNFADGQITGKYFVDPSANNSHSNNVKIAGGTVTQSLSPAVSNVLNISSEAAGYTPTQSVPQNINGSYTINGAYNTNQQVRNNNGLNIIDLNSINETGGGQYVTLSGSSNDYFLINVSGSIKLTHSGGGIQVSGGVTPSHVFFNILSNTNDGLKVSGNASLVGTYVAPHAGIGLDPAQLEGEIISGKNIALTSGVWIKQEPFWPPSSCY